MIPRERMLAAMLAVCPSFRSAWEAFLAEWADEDDPPLYLALGDLARHLVELLERGELDSFPAVFEVVERWHVDGDAYVREAATVGLLEDLQNANLYLSARPEDFLPWLGPESRRWWDKLLDYWEGRGPLAG